MHIFQETDVFQFEMDESQLSNILSSIDEIEKKLTSYAQWNFTSLSLSLSLSLSQKGL